MAEEVSKLNGVSKILVADSPVFKGFLAEAMSPLVLEAQKQFNFTHIFSNASAFGKVCGIDLCFILFFDLRKV